MRKAVCLALTIVMLSLAGPVCDDVYGSGVRGDHRGSRGVYHGGDRGGYYGVGHRPGVRWGASVWIGPQWSWGGWGPWWGYPYTYYPWYPYPWYDLYYSVPPIVVERQPYVYVEPTPLEETDNYWYYCKNPEGYYPYVTQCPGGWTKVAPSPAPDRKE